MSCLKTVYLLLFNEVLLCHISFTFLSNQLVFPNQILALLVPEEEADMSDLVLEVTAGVGGQEAMLFTAEVCALILYASAFDIYVNMFLVGTK